MYHLSAFHPVELCICVFIISRKLYEISVNEKVSGFIRLLNKYALRGMLIGILNFGLRIIMCEGTLPSLSCILGSK